MAKVSPAILTESLLARKGEARPAAAVIDYFGKGMPCPTDESSRGSHALPGPTKQPDITEIVAAGNLPDLETCGLALPKRYLPERVEQPPSTEASHTRSRGAKARGRRHALVVRLDADRYARFRVLTRLNDRTNQDMLLAFVDEHLDRRLPWLADSGETAKRRNNFDPSKIFEQSEAVGNGTSARRMLDQMIQSFKTGPGQFLNTRNIKSPHAPVKVSALSNRQG